METMMSRLRYATASAVLVSGLLMCSPASAFFHLWKFAEFFSSPDGNVQFIEMYTDAPSENFSDGVTIMSQSTGKVFTFSGTLSGSTFQKRLLIASPDFASKPGAVTPDYTFDTNNFFNAAGDTLIFGPSSFPYDSKTFASVPTDGTNSRIYIPSEALATNSPTNFAGATGSVNLAPPAPSGDYNGNGSIDAADYVVWRNTLTQTASPSGSGADGNANGTIDDGDYTYWRARFGNTVQAAAAGMATAVPEPATLALVLMGLFLVALRRRL